jgi:hypothetical protein
MGYILKAGCVVVCVCAPWAAARPSVLNRVCGIQKKGEDGEMLPGPPMDSTNAKPAATSGSSAAPTS